jgi:Arc/MetJ-type ribon-helix-helix transcriptional regulator
MVLSVKSRTKRLIETRLRSGKYGSADELIEAGLVALQQQEHFGDFRPGELDALLKTGERSLRRGGVAASEVFADLRRRSSHKRGRTRKAG